MESKTTSNKQISINMIANIVSYSTNILVAFVLTPYLINKLGKETYSFYPIANTIVNYMAILMNAMNSIASRFVTISIVRNETEESNKYFSSTLAANLIMSAVVAIPMIVIVLFLEHFMDVPINSLAAVRTLFILMFTSTLINITATVFGIATFAKNRIDLRSLRELIVALVKLALYVLLYKFFPPSIVYVGVVILSTGVLNLIIQFIYTRKLLPEIHISVSYFSVRHVKELLASSCWTAVNSFGNQLLVGMSLILANVFYGANASGAYSIVNTVPQFLSGIISMMIGVFYPVITYAYAQKNKNELIASVKKSQRFVGVFGCSVATVFAALSKEFFILWTPNENANELAMYTYIIIIPYFFISCLWTLTNMNIIMNKVKIPAIITMLFGVLNIVLTFGSYKFLDVGLISLPIISTFLQVMWVGIFIPQYVNQQLCLPAKSFYGVLIRAVPCSIVLFFTIRFVKGFVNITNSWISFILYGGFCGVIALIIFAMVIFEPKKVLSWILKEKRIKT